MKWMKNIDFCYLEEYFFNVIINYIILYIIYLRTYYKLVFES